MVVSSTAVDDLEEIASASDGSQVVAAVRVRRAAAIGGHARTGRRVGVPGDLLDRGLPGGGPATSRHAERVHDAVRPRRRRRSRLSLRVEPDVGRTCRSSARTPPGCPVLVKGILTAEDATIAVEHGVGGDRRVEPRRATARRIVPRVAGRAPRGGRGRGRAGPGPDGRRRPSRHRRGEGTRAWARPRSSSAGRSRGVSRRRARTAWPGSCDPPRGGRECDGARAAAARSRRSIASSVAPCSRRGRPRSLSDSLQAMPGYDLHSHSNRSDGTLTPSEAMQLAASKDLAGVALTDHDTFEGLDEASAAAGELGLEFVPGIEFSAEYEGASLHVLGYWVDPGRPGDRRRSSCGSRATRFRRGEMIVEKLRELGSRHLASTASWSSPRAARSRGRTSRRPWSRRGSWRTRRRRSSATSPTTASRTCRSTPCIRWTRSALIGDAGGVCVLAHPGMWRGTDTVPDALIEEMAAGGMVGLEVFHPDHDEEHRAKYAAVRSGSIWWRRSSDCHGERYGRRMGEERTDAETFAELTRTPPGSVSAPMPAGSRWCSSTSGACSTTTRSTRGRGTARCATRGRPSPTTSSRRSTPRARAAQSGSFRAAAGARFLPDADLRELEGTAAAHWALPAVGAVRRRRPVPRGAAAAGTALGVIANQPSAGPHGDAARRAEPFFEVWGVSTTSACGKPDPALFVHALRDGARRRGAQRSWSGTGSTTTCAPRRSRACGRCGCSAARRPTSRHPSSSRSRTRRSATCAELLPATSAGDGGVTRDTS